MYFVKYRVGQMNFGKHGNYRVGQMYYGSGSSKRSQSILANTERGICILEAAVVNLKWQVQCRSNVFWQIQSKCILEAAVVTPAILLSPPL